MPRDIYLKRPQYISDVVDGDTSGLWPVVWGQYSTWLGVLGMDTDTAQELFLIDYNRALPQYKTYPLIFFHPKTTEIRYPEKSIIYAQNAADGNPLHQRDLTMCFTRAQIIIRDLIKSQKTFYSDNETGESVAAWLRPMHLAAR